ncbi:MAG: ABC transporter permease [Candidatus Saccharimonadales bacterium]
MIDTITSEFRKLLTIRSTYITSTIALVLIGIIAFYFKGIKSDGAYSPFGDTGVQETVINLMPVVGIFVGIVALLHVCHEYRYNTIGYTLTATNFRIKVLLAKTIVILAYAAAMTILAILFVSLLAPLGAKLGHATVPAQDFAFWDILWRSMAYMMSNAMVAMLFGFIFRNLVFSIVLYFVLPTTVEPLLTNLFKLDPNWTLISAQGHILMPNSQQFSPLASLGVVALYIAAGWVIASALFVRRDAN